MYNSGTQIRVLYNILSKLIIMRQTLKVQRVFKRYVHLFPTWIDEPFFQVSSYTIRIINSQLRSLFIPQRYDINSFRSQAFHSIPRATSRSLHPAFYPLYLLSLSP